MTDDRKLRPKSGQHLGKRVRKPKKTSKGAQPVTPQRVKNTRPEPFADWERELLNLTLRSR